MSRVTSDSLVLPDDGRAAAHTPEDIARGQRAAWAAGVCEGLSTLTVTGDGDEALARLSSRLGDGDVPWQAVAWPDGLAAAASLDRVAEVLGHAVSHGLRVAVAVPNTRMLPTREARGSLGADEARRLADAIDGEIVAAQFLADGALIRSTGRPTEALDARVRHDLVGDPEDAVAWLLAAGVPGDAVGAGLAEATITFAPARWAYLTRLERANEELQLANTRLARKSLGVHDAAAASVIGRIDAELREEQARNQQLAGENEYLKKQLEIEVEVARRNDEYFQAARAKLNQRHHRLVEAVHRRTVRVLRKG